VLHLRDGNGPVLDPEVCRRATRAEIRDEWIVGVEDEPRAVGQRCGHRRPAFGDRLQLAVAIELVTEQVAEQDRTRRQLRADAIQPELVDLEEAELAFDAPTVGGAEQSGGHPAGHVGARAVMDESDARALQHRGGHGRSGRLAVGGRNHRATLRQACGQLTDCVGLEADEQLARQTRPAAAAGTPGHCPDPPGDNDLGAEQVHRPAGTRTRTAAGSASISTGRRAIGSPSA
jgi:hypothetical protein